MTIHRAAAKRDANEAEIIKALRAAGCSVAQISARGLPDLLVGTPSGTNLLLEVKRPGAKLTASEAAFFAAWQGQRSVVHSVEEALAVIETVAE